MSGPELSVDLVRFVIKHGSAKKLLKEHAADPSGRCPKCAGGGDSSGRVKAPCSLYLAAEAAEKLGGSKT